jgi:hypothetical protein
MANGFVAAGLAIFVVSACARPVAPGAKSTLMSGVPRPDTTVTTSHTVDNAGFVDNGGRTSDETSRTQFSGMRATEAGSERPTGTTGGVPLPLDPPTPPPLVGEGAGQASSVRGTSGPPPSGAPTSDALARIAHARCDREMACNRVGNGRPWRHLDACLETQRERARRLLDPTTCRRGVDNVQLAACLTDLRTVACNDPKDDDDSVESCRTSALCVP